MSAWSKAKGGRAARGHQRIPVIVSTDAHAPEDLLRTEGAYEYLADIHYPEVLRNPWRT